MLQQIWFLCSCVWLGWPSMFWYFKMLRLADSIFILRSWWWGITLVVLKIFLKTGAGCLTFFFGLGLGLANWNGLGWSVFSASSDFVYESVSSFIFISSFMSVFFDSSQEIVYGKDDKSLRSNTFSGIVLPCMKYLMYISWSFLSGSSSVPKSVSLRMEALGSNNELAYLFMAKPPTLFFFYKLFGLLFINIYYL